MDDSVIQMAPAASLSQSTKIPDPAKLEALLRTSSLAAQVRMDMQDKIQARHVDAVQKICDIFSDGSGGECTIRLIEDPHEMKTTLVFDDKGADRAVVFTREESRANGQIQFVTAAQLTLDGHTEIVDMGRLGVRTI